jgi:hypothetical protein
MFLKMQENVFKNKKLFSNKLKRIICYYYLCSMIINNNLKNIDYLYVKIHI